LRPGAIAKVLLYHRNSWAYWIELMLRLGVFRGELFRGLTPGEIMSKYVEFNEAAGRPLVKVYRRREARKLFAMFSEVRIEVDQLTRAEVYFVGEFIPEWLFRIMRRSIGWNIIITAIK